MSDARSWTFAMIDLAGFTALTEAHGDEQAANLALNLAEIARASLAEEDRLVKMLGDAVLLASTTPAAGVQLVSQILRACAAEDEFLSTRTGMHCGPAAERDGDFFGASVNLTARVTAHASGGQVLATSPVAAAAGELGMAVTPIGRADFKNVGEPVELFELDLGSGTVQESVDPVCRMRVKHSQAVGRLRHEGVDYWFCSLACAGAFARQHVSGS